MSSRIKNSLNRMSEANERLVEQYLTRLQAKGLSENTLRTYAGVLLKADRSTDSKGIEWEYINDAKREDWGKRKPFTKWTENDCNKLLKSIEKQNSRNTTGITLKTFMRSIGKGEIMDSWTPMQSFNLLPEIPSDEEILAILKEMDDTKFRSFFHVLVDSGARVSSILGVRKHEIAFKTVGGVMTAIITLSGATVKGGIGLRLRLISSAPGLKEWLNHCPASPDGRVWNVSYNSVRRRFHTAVKKAGIEKRLTIHSLRHARATQMVRSGMTEQLLRRQFGWQPGSRMSEKYVHLVGEDLDNAIFKMSGIELPEKALSVGLKPIKCPVCGKQNDPTWSFCADCSRSLTGASTSIDGLIDTLNNLLEVTDVNKEIDELLKQQKIYGPDSFRNQERIMKTLFLLSAFDKKIAMGLTAIDQRAKQLDAAAELEQNVKKVRKPRARSASRTSST